MDLEVKMGDTSPLRRYQLVDVDGNPPNLTGASVVQRFKGAPEAGSPCVIDGPATDGIVRLASREHLPAPAPRRSSTTVDFETEVTYAGGEIQTFPTAGYDRWLIWQDLDDLAEGAS
jgi:hypothetical protein